MHLKLIAQMMALYLLMGSLIPRTDLSQLLKLSELAVHYEQHNLETRDGSEEISPVSFVLQHFLKPESHHASHGDDAHKDLPFHSFQSTFVATAMAIGLEDASLPGLSVSSKPFYTHKFHLSGSLGSIDHPPSV